MIALPAAAAPSPLWYLTRGAGTVSLLLLTASVALGIIDVSRLSSERWPRFVVDGLHRNVSLLALVVLVAHIFTAILDSFAPISLKDAVIPFTSSYRPLWLGLGALSFDLLLAITVTSLLRRHLGHRTWRGVHWAAYACWPLALVHGLGTGSDTKLGWMLILDVLCVLAVLAAIGWRIADGWPHNRQRRVLAGWATALAAVVLPIWLIGGPLGANWAARAGTPRTLLAATRGGGAASAGGAQSSALKLPFTAQVSGSVGQSGPSENGLEQISLPLKMSGGASGSLDIRLIGQALENGGVEMSQSSVTLGPPGQPALYRGQIDSLTDRRITASVSDGSGSTARLDLNLDINQASGNASGTLRAVGG